MLSPSKGIIPIYFGDEAPFIDEPCECDRTTPRIKDIKRVKDLARLESGCRWLQGVGLNLPYLFLESNVSIEWKRSMKNGCHVP